MGAVGIVLGEWLQNRDLECRAIITGSSGEARPLPEVPCASWNPTVHHPAVNDAIDNLTRHGYLTAREGDEEDSVILSSSPAISSHLARGSSCSSFRSAEWVATGADCSYRTVGERASLGQIDGAGWGRYARQVRESRFLFLGVCAADPVLDEYIFTLEQLQTAADSYHKSFFEEWLPANVQVLLGDVEVGYDPDQDLIRIFCGAVNLEDPDLLKDLPINRRCCQPWRR